MPRMRYALWCACTVPCRQVRTAQVYLPCRGGGAGSYLDTTNLINQNAACTAESGCEHSPLKLRTHVNRAFLPMHYWRCGVCSPYGHRAVAGYLSRMLGMKPPESPDVIGGFSESVEHGAVGVACMPVRICIALLLVPCGVFDSGCSGVWSSNWGQRATNIHTLLICRGPPPLTSMQHHCGSVLCVQHHMAFGKLERMCSTLQYLLQSTRWRSKQRSKEWFPPPLLTQPVLGHK